MAGSGASNLGNSLTKPFSNVNGNYANKMSENYSGGFSSNEIPTGGANGLHGIKDNVLALSGKVSNLSFFKGGAKSKSKSNRNIKRKIKNITKLYKMRSKKRAKTIKRKLIKKYKKNNNNASANNNFFLGLSSGGKKSRSRSIRRQFNQKGGYSQYQNNLPMTPSYSVGGHLSAGSSALATPPPIFRNANAGTGTCTDNYNHFTGAGFPSRGH